MDVETMIIDYDVVLLSLYSSLLCRDSKADMSALGCRNRSPMLCGPGQISVGVCGGVARFAHMAAI